jgi:hypothetical protein
VRCYEIEGAMDGVVLDPLVSQVLLVNIIEEPPRLGVEV